MTVHPDVEILSTYLDRELGRQAQGEVEEHLERCDDCREKLTGLQKVVGNLQALERLAPPPHLGTHLHRLASVEAAQPTLIQRLEQHLSRFSLQPSIVPIFAVVMALILIIYMLSWGLHRQATGRIPVRLEPEVSESTPVAGQAMGSSRQIAGRAFTLIAGIWVEEGLQAEEVAEAMSGSDPAVQSWLAATPELQELATLGDPVRVRLEERVVEIRFDTP